MTTIPKATKIYYSAGEGYPKYIPDWLLRRCPHAYSARPYPYCHCNWCRWAFNPEYHPPTCKCDSNIYPAKRPGDTSSSSASNHHDECTCPECSAKKEEKSPSGMHLVTPMVGGNKVTWLGCKIAFLVPNSGFWFRPTC